MPHNPLVSAIIIFLDAERFLEEAIESVLAQTYPHWELLLVDDGSQDTSPEIAKQYVGRFPNKIRYLAQPGRQNRGMGAARNLGIHHARGEYVAFLDSDDLWLPEKLSKQVPLLESFPEAGMLYGNTLYWYSWTGKPEHQDMDLMPELGVPVLTLMRPPNLLTRFLQGQAAVPCTCSILVRRNLTNRVGGFDESFLRVANIYEDQAFYAKVCLETPVIASNSCLELYRQHEGASTAVALKTGMETTARRYFLGWLQTYLDASQIQAIPVRMAVKRELWRVHAPAWLPERYRATFRWIKKWMLRGELAILPERARRWIWRN